MENVTLKNLYEAKQILSNYRNHTQEINELKRQLKNCNPHSDDYVRKVEHQTYPLTDAVEIFSALGISVLVSAIATLVIRVLLTIILSLVYLFEPGPGSEAHDKMKEFVFKIPMWISDNLLEGRPGLFTSEPSFLEKSLFGMLIMFLVIGIIIAVLYLVWCIMSAKKDNDKKNAAVRQEKKFFDEQKADFRKNPGSYEAYCKKINDEIYKMQKNDTDTERRLVSLLDAVHCPNQYRNLQAINMFISYIENGRAYDIVGAINQINYDANQRQLLAEAQATRAAQERAAKAAHDAAIASRNAAQATEQANQDEWFRYYMKKK